MEYIITVKEDNHSKLLKAIKSFKVTKSTSIVSTYGTHVEVTVTRGQDLVNILQDIDYIECQPDINDLL